MSNKINFIVSLWLGILFKESSHLVNAVELTTPSVIPPKILLERYKIEKSKRWVGWVTLEEENFNPEILIKDGEDYIVVDSKNVTEILLTCRAPYPVYWVMTDVQPLRIDHIATNSRAILKDLSKGYPEVKEFVSYLEVYNDVSYTGLYTCRSFSEETLNKSTYVFLPGLKNETKILLGAGREVEVGLNGQDFIVIPCKVSKKTAVVSLSKQDENGDWNPLSLNSSFDPKVGFKLGRNDVETTEGVYKCTVESTEEFNVTVIQTGHAAPEFPIKNDVHEEAFWKQYGNGVACCSNSSKAPTLLMVVCENGPECDMKKTAYMNLMPNKVTPGAPGLISTKRTKRSSCTRTQSEVSISMKPFLIQCRGDGLNVSGQYATEFDLPTFDTMKYVPSASIENDTYNIDTFIRFQILKHTNHTRWGEITNYFTNMDLRKTYLYTGDKFMVVCCGLHYYHAIGRIQRIIWENGTTSNLTTPEEKDFSNAEEHAYSKDFCSTNTYDPDAFSYEEYLLTAEENMNQVECIVPRWNDKKLVVKRIPLNIKVPREPVIISSEEVVNTTYTENQVGLLQLDCKLSQNIPPPKMIWTKDGYKINQTDKHWSLTRENDDRNNLIGLNVLFMRATKAIEGEYVCTAENWKGAAEITYFVKVNPRSYLDYWIALVIFGGFFAVIICCALRISNVEKQTALKKVNPVSYASGN